MDDMTVHIEQLSLTSTAASTGEGILEAIREQAPGLTAEQLAAVSQGVQQSLPPATQGHPND